MFKILSVNPLYIFVLYNVIRGLNVVVENTLHNSSLSLVLVFVGLTKARSRRAVCYFFIFF